jgi:DNA-binding MarR family transcriptional regulator
MFGRMAAPYRDGTGNSQAGPSADRQEREDGTGLSAYRQTMALGLLESEGPMGMTVSELASKTGWHHGQASNVLSVLDKAGHIKRLEDQREGKSIYVLEQFMAGRNLARRRRTTEEKIRAEFGQKVADLEEANASLRAHVARSDATVGEASWQLARRDATIMDLSAQSDRQREAFERRLTEAGTMVARLQGIKSERDTWMQASRVIEAQLQSVQRELLLARDELERSQVRVNALQTDLEIVRNENAARRIEKHVRMTLEPDEAGAALRVGTILGKESVQLLGDDEVVKVTLGVLRTFMRIVGRATKFSTENVDNSL